MKIPANVKTVIDEELERLNILEKHSAEFKFVDDRTTDGDNYDSFRFDLASARTIWIG